MDGKLEPPEHLTDESKWQWRRIVEENAIDVAAYPILIMLYEARDRREHARLMVEQTGGAVMKDRFGQMKANPWAAVERDNALIMIRAYKSLGFDQALPGQGNLFS